MDLEAVLFDIILTESEQYDDGRESVLILKDYALHMCASYSALQKIKSYDPTRWFDGLGCLAHLELDYGNKVLNSEFGFRALGDYVHTGDPLGLYTVLQHLLEYADGKNVDNWFMAETSWDLYAQAFENVPAAAEVLHALNLNTLGKRNMIQQIKSGYIFDLETIVEDGMLIKALTDNGSYLMRRIKGTN